MQVKAEDVIDIDYIKNEGSNEESHSVYHGVNWVIFIITTKIYIKMRINRI